jgi:hypothetical protein
VSRLRELLAHYRRLWRGAVLFAMVLCWGCADVVKTSGAAVTCVQHVMAAMRTAPDCPSKLRAADLVAQTDKACAAADLIDLGLVCPDGGHP